MLEFMENLAGVHLMYGRSTICGETIDIDYEDDNYVCINGTLKKTKQQIVTCPECIHLIKYCRYVKIKE